MDVVLGNALFKGVRNGLVHARDILSTWGTGSGIAFIYVYQRICGSRRKRDQLDGMDALLEVGPFIPVQPPLV